MFIPPIIKQVQHIQGGIAHSLLHTLVGKADLSAARGNEEAHGGEL